MARPMSDARSSPDSPKTFWRATARFRPWNGFPEHRSDLRADRENSAHRDGFGSFQITERLPQGQLARAGDREEYFPVFFVEPLKGNEKALGFDLASDPVRNEALKRAAATGSLVATSRVKLVQETGDQYGFLVFRPVYRGGVQPSSVQDRRARLMGFALAVFRVGDIVEKAGAIANAASGLHVAIFDLDAETGESGCSIRRAPGSMEPETFPAASGRFGRSRLPAADG